MNLFANDIAHTSFAISFVPVHPSMDNYYYYDSCGCYSEGVGRGSAGGQTVIYLFAKGRTCVRAGAWPQTFDCTLHRARCILQLQVSRLLIINWLHGGTRIHSHRFYYGLMFSYFSLFMLLLIFTACDLWFVKIYSWLRRCRARQLLVILYYQQRKQNYKCHDINIVKLTKVLIDLLQVFKKFSWEQFSIIQR